MAAGTECEWLLENVPGSRVEMEVTSLTLPQSEMCSESYLLLREFSSTGPVIGADKYCGEASTVPRVEVSRGGHFSH